MKLTIGTIELPDRKVVIQHPSYTLLPSLSRVEQEAPAALDRMENGTAQNQLTFLPTFVLH